MRSMLEEENRCCEPEVLSIASKRSGNVASGQTIVGYVTTDRFSKPSREVSILSGLGQRDLRRQLRDEDPGGV